MKPQALAIVAMTALTLVLSLAAPAAMAQPTCSAVPADDWRTTADYIADDFFVSSAMNTEEPRWIKFTILLCDPTTVYFQDGRQYRFHYDFARARLRPFLTSTREQFDAATLHGAGQQAVLGAVLLPGFSLPWNGSPGHVIQNEMAIQLVRQDAYTREQVRDYFNLVKSKITRAEGVSFFYFPTLEQLPSAEAERDWLASQGITVATPDRWIQNSACYSQGWAVGRMNFVPGAEVGDAFRAGTLLPTDILLTDGVPAEVPPVAGIVSLAPATPNSHAALLSQTWGIPMVYAARDNAAAAQALIGRRAIVRSYVSNGTCRVDVTDAEILPESAIEEMLEMKEIPPLEYAPMIQTGAYVIGVDNLTSADVERVGGKAANYGILRRSIPQAVRPGCAITFDLWTEFLNQTISTGRTLRQEIAHRLAPYGTWPPADPDGLADALEGIRDLFTDTSATSFTAAQQQAILTALQNPAFEFDPDVKIRFRSSTNVEDTETFTGAGLYESFSGCLRDDLDDDTVGPSHCEAEQNNERGVFRAIRRVYASFYYDNAYLARVRLGVDENQVGMAMLCHHSFPDSTELANGVAVLYAAPFGSYEVTIVSQPGALSVTNPEDGSIPEEAFVLHTSFGVYPEIRRSSSRLVLGETVMPFPSDYTTLSTLLVTAANRYASENGVTGRYALDFEFKRTTPNGALEIKQVRPIPVPGTNPTITPMLVNRPQRWCLFQGEVSDVLANHRLKAEFLLANESRRMTSANLAGGILADASLRFNTGCRIAALAGRPDSWPGASWSFAMNTGTQRWRYDQAPNPRTYTLEIESIPTLVSAAQSPVLWLSDFGQGSRHLLHLRADYDQPVPGVDWNNQIVNRTTDDAFFCPCPEPQGLPIERTFGDGELQIVTRYEWVPGGAPAGYTFDLAAWHGTTITGLTSLPIHLTSPWSQTYRPGHHNFYESFIFDPRLEPGIAPAILHELAQQDIAYLMILDVGSLNPRFIRMSDTCMPCPVDWDASGAVGVEDIFRFLAAWFSGDLRADWDASGGLNVQDLFNFLAAYFQGC